MSPGVGALLVALHLGSMHPFEKWLTVVLAFGPFLVLAVVVVVRRRQEAQDAADDGSPGPVLPSEEPPPRPAS